MYEVRAVLSSTRRKNNNIEPCIGQTKSWFKLLSINMWCKIPSPVGTYWLCGTSIYSELPAQFNGRCTLVYALPAIREYLGGKKSQPPDIAKGNYPQLRELPPSVSWKDDCIPGLTCAQTWWSRTLGALIPSYGVMQALDQVRSLSN